VHRGLDAVIDASARLAMESTSASATARRLTRGATYPDAIVAHLRAAGALPADGVVVDIGVERALRGTVPARRSHRDGVEPNAAMRRLATSASRITAAT